jgi:CheY-like chemotaxis protein/HPt (histidine-containing phosphotransfer) domain-containing protein
MRILVADDDPTNRELLSELLISGGHSVTTVLDGREVLAAIAKEPFEVVLMDEEMPRMSGLEAARAIVAAAQQGERRPIIVGISGNATKEDEARCLEAGMDAFFPKPVRAAELFSVLAVLARRAPAGPAAAAQPGELTLESLAANLDRATGGNHKIARTLVKTFLEDAPKRMTVLRRAVEEKDSDAVAAAAHALKGSLSLIGALKAAGTARNLQAMGRLGTLDGASGELGVLEREFEELQRKLAALRGNSDSPPRSGPRTRRK